MERSLKNSDSPTKSPSEPPNRREPPQGDASAAPVLPVHLAGSGALDRLVETARGYARQAAAKNTLTAYAKDWAHFTRWCRLRGAEPLPASP